MSVWWGSRVECVSAISQLAAAWAACENNPMSLEFVSMDDRFSEAAAKEGFRVQG